jgi:hypothetical protein
VSRPKCAVWVEWWYIEMGRRTQPPPALAFCVWMTRWGCDPILGHQVLWHWVAIQDCLIQELLNLRYRGKFLAVPNQHTSEYVKGVLCKAAYIPNWCILNLKLLSASSFRKSCWYLLDMRMHGTLSGSRYSGVKEKNLCSCQELKSHCSVWATLSAEMPLSSGVGLIPLC